MSYQVTLENIGGKLDEKILEVREGDDEELMAAMVNWLFEVGYLRSGDTIKIVAVE